MQKIPVAVMAAIDRKWPGCRVHWYGAPARTGLSLGDSVQIAIGVLIIAAAALAPFAARIVPDVPVDLLPAKFGWFQLVVLSFGAAQVVVPLWDWAVASSAHHVVTDTAIAILRGEPAVLIQHWERPSLRGYELTVDAAGRGELILGRRFYRGRKGATFSDCERVSGLDDVMAMARAVDRLLDRDERQRSAPLPDFKASAKGEAHFLQRLLAGEVVRWSGLGSRRHALRRKAFELSAGWVIICVFVIPLFCSAVRVSTADIGASLFGVLLVGAFAFAWLREAWWIWLAGSTQVIVTDRAIYRIRLGRRPSATRIDGSAVGAIEVRAAHGEVDVELRYERAEEDAACKPTTLFGGARTEGLQAALRRLQANRPPA